MIEILLVGLHAADDFIKRFDRPDSADFSSAEVQEIRPRILVVDDERLIADTLTEILEGGGFEVTTAYDGRMALETAARLKPDYVLSDVVMPRFNGVELAIAIHKIHPTAKILLLSGNAGVTGILDEGRRQGFEFRMVMKPIHPLRLLEALRELE